MSITVKHLKFKTVIFPIILTGIHFQIPFNNKIFSQSQQFEKIKTCMLIQSY